MPEHAEDLDPCCSGLAGSPLAADEAEEIAAFLKALADPVRLRLVSMVATSPSGEVCACDLPAPLGRTQATISHHLGLLVNAGVLDREQRGKWAWFRIHPESADSISAALAILPVPTGQV